MQWLAAISVKRPVFASVLILALTVVGAFAFTRLGLDRFPKVDFPTVVVTTRCRAPRPKRSRPRSPTRSRKRSTRSAASTSCARPRRKASRRSSSRSCSRRTPTSRRRKCAIASTASLPLLPEDHRAADGREVRSRLRAGADARGLGRQADPRHHRVRRQDAAPPARERQRRRPGRRRRRPAAPDQHLARSGAAAGLQPHRHRRVARAAGAERRDPGRPRRGGRAGAHAADARPRPVGRRSSATSSSRQRDGHPILLRDVATIEDGMADATTQGERERRADRAAHDPPPVRHQHGPGRRRGQGAARRHQGRDAAGLRHPRRPRPLGVHPGVDRHRRGAPGLGSILAALVVLVFLWNWRSTLIAAIAIPTSIIATFGLIWYEGFTLNSMTMLALTLAVGIVIDDAIVVLENIYRFVEEKGMTAVPGGGRGDARNRPRRPRDDAVADRDLRPGRLHGRHRRPLHDQLRVHDVVRDPGVAARQLHADADAVGALDQDAAATEDATATKSDHGSKDTRFFRPLDAGYAQAAVVVAGASRGRRRRWPCSCC